jgi:hypothetical protein
MNRKQLIDAIKFALDTRDFARVLELADAAADQGLLDVADHARIARVRVMEGGPVSRTAAAREASERMLKKRIERGAVKAAEKNMTQLKEGFFTVVLKDETHITFKIERQALDSKFAPGELVISRLHGPQNESDYHGVAFAKDDGRIITWKKFRGDQRLSDALIILARDPKAAGLGYARESGCCYVCGRMLSTPESIAIGIGPVCLEKGY